MNIPLRYHDRRLEGETPLRQCQLVQLHLLYVFDAICKEHHLTYFLGGGTLLGAMRHQGFIPWDDDLDVGMPMKDYKRFLKIAPTVLPQDVKLQTPKDVPHTAIPFAKLRDMYSFYYEMRPDIATTDPSGIYLDVFPYEEMPAIGQPLQFLLVKLCGSSWQRAIYFRNWARNSFWLALPGFFIGLFCHCINLLTHLLIQFLKLFLPHNHIYIQLDNGYAFGSGRIFRFCKGDLYPTTEHLFEDGNFPVPNKPGKFLTTQYGDWQVIPPPEKRPRHANIILPITAPTLPGTLKFPGTEK